MDLKTALVTLLTSLRDRYGVTSINYWLLTLALTLLARIPVAAAGTFSALPPADADDMPEGDPAEWTAQAIDDWAIRKANEAR